MSNSHKLFKLFLTNSTFILSWNSGFAERCYHHLVDTALTLMSHASFPNNLWPDAFHTATFLINRLPTPTLNGKSPYEIVYDTTPSYKILECLGVLVILILLHLADPNLIPNPFLVYLSATPLITKVIDSWI